MLTLPVALVIWIGAGFLSQRCPNSDEGKIAMAIISLGAQGFNGGGQNNVVCSPHVPDFSFEQNSGVPVK
jgi:hypothetical protein